MTSPIVFTNKARCRDCYKCLRACPVKAIRVQEGQARVVAEDCIACGTCVRACPQGAKQVRDDIAAALALLDAAAERGDPVAVSVAPSFPAVLGEDTWRRLPSALRRLGFSFIAETAVGAHVVARSTREHVAAHPDQSHVSSCCPAVVAYVESEHPELVPLLVPVVSPMLEHARSLKARLGSASKVVFVGPCVAKKAEAERAPFAGLVDVVLTFRELAQVLEARGVHVHGCEESDFDEQPGGASRFFALPGGLIRAAKMDEDVLSADSVTAAGLEDVTAALEDLSGAQRSVFLEPLFCAQGCVSGAGTEQAGHNTYRRRAAVIRYARDHHGADAERVVAAERAEFAPRSGLPTYSEAEIRTVLGRTGKAEPADQLNCGGCGYATCRDQALAVLRGMAEPEMCVPYMRRLAEQRTDRIIETSPNGILILDDQLRILAMNPAFRRLFTCSDAVLGKSVSYLMDPAPFERVTAGVQEIVERTHNHERYGVVCHELLYRLPAERQVVGIFVNVTQTKEAQVRLERLRSETLKRAEELLQHQVRTAQRVAQLLGESTAQGETLMQKLVLLAAGKGEDEALSWPWDTST
jgi:PAS domain S-box-containing protein